MIIWRLMDACVKKGIAKFIISDCRPSTRSLVAKLQGFQGVKYTCDRVIEFEAMRKLTLESCGLQDRLAEDPARPGFYRINQFFFPTASEVNGAEQRAAKRKRE